MIILIRIELAKLTDCIADVSRTYVNNNNNYVPARAPTALWVTWRAWFLINLGSIPHGLIHFGLGARLLPPPLLPRLELMGRATTQSAQSDK